MKRFLQDYPDPNSLSILRTVWLNPRISRVEIAKIIGVDQSTVSRLTSQLIDKGLIEELEGGASGPTGGRRRVYLRINAHYGCFLGLEISSNAIFLVGIDLDAQVLFQTSEDFPPTEIPLVEHVYQTICRGLELVAKTGHAVLGIGVGLPGIIDSPQGIVHRSNPLDVESPLPLQQELEARVRLPIRIEHDARCGCCGELVFQRGRSPENFLFLLGEFRRATRTKTQPKGVAIGMALVIGNRVYSGENHAAGEFRSVLRGVGSSNLIFSIPDKDLERMEEDPEIQERFSHELGRNLALITNILDLSVVYIGGSVVKIGSTLVPILTQEMEENWAYPRQHRSEFLFASTDRFCVAFGAACLFLDFIYAPQDRTIRHQALISP